MDIFYSLGVSPNTCTDRNSAEYSRKLSEELQASLSIYRSHLSGIPSYELYLPWSPWILSSSVFSTQGGYGLYLISWVPLPELQPENSQRQWSEAITGLTSFASISRDHCHSLFDVWCLELLFKVFLSTYSWLFKVGRKINLGLDTALQLETEVLKIPFLILKISTFS